MDAANHADSVRVAVEQGELPNDLYLGFKLEAGGRAQGFAASPAGQSSRSCCCRQDLGAARRRRRQQQHRRSGIGGVSTLDPRLCLTSRALRASL